MDKELVTGNNWWRRMWIDHRPDRVSTYAEYDRTKGWVLTPSLRNAPIFFTKHFSTNSVGGRGTREFDLAPPTDKIRVLMLGDSFTFGSDVNDDETFSHFLEKDHSRLEVLNFGVPGYGQDQALILLKEIVNLYHPSFVVLGFLEMDIERNMLSFREYSKPYFEIENEELVLKNSPVPSLESVRSAEWYKRGLFDLLSSLVWQIKVRTGHYNREMYKKTDLILGEMKRVVETAGATPVFFYLPFGRELHSEVDVAAEVFLKNTCKKYDVVCSSARPAMNQAWKMGEKLGAASDGRAHYSPDGHRLVAKSLAGTLMPLVEKIRLDRGIKSH